VQAKVSVAPEALKPELEVYTLRNALTGHERRRDAARDRLSALLGGAPVPVDRLVRPEPRAESALPTLVKRALDRHPALRAARQETETAQARLAMARTAERPDIEVSVLVGRDFDENEYVAELGVGIPLAVFDAGQGAIFEARALVAKSRRDAEALEKRIATEVTVRFGEREAARAQLRDLREQLLPLAERTLAATREAYEAGTQEFLDVLDAQRTLLEARAAALALERDTAAADAELAAITGE
jgi:cobalt-zinc-cadmium efflux system outer membrane protein